MFRASCEIKSVRLQSCSLRKCGVILHGHYFQTHFDPEWLYLLKGPIYNFNRSLKNYSYLIEMCKQKKKKKKKKKKHTATTQKC